jgi:hypothetical protein
LNPGCFICFTFIFILFRESCLLVSWCAGGRCGLGSSDEDRAGVGDLVQRIRNDHTGRVLDDQTIGRSGDAVCGLHRAREDEERMFLD